MQTLSETAGEFVARLRRFEREMVQSAAFFLATGIDLAEALAATGEARHRIVLRVERLCERERQKGQRRHWSYDLDRHIALGEVLARLRAARAA